MKSMALEGNGFVFASSGSGSLPCTSDWGVHPRWWEWARAHMCRGWVPEGSQCPDSNSLLPAAVWP